MLLFACDLFFHSFGFSREKQTGTWQWSRSWDLFWGPHRCASVKGWALWQGQTRWDCVDRQLVITRLFPRFSHAPQISILVNVRLSVRETPPAWKRLSLDKNGTKTRDLLVRCHWLLWNSETLVMQSLNFHRANNWLGRSWPFEFFSAEVENWISKTRTRRKMCPNYWVFSCP